MVVHRARISQGMADHDTKCFRDFEATIARANFHLLESLETCDVLATLMVLSLSVCVDDARWYDYSPPQKKDLSIGGLGHVGRNEWRHTWCGERV